MDKATTLGPLSTEAALVQLLDQVDRAVCRGFHSGDGKQMSRSTGFIHPADDPGKYQTQQSRFYGRVVRAGRAFFRFNNEDEGLALADFGLGGSVFTQDVARGKRVASRIDTA